MTNPPVIYTAPSVYNHLLVGGCVIRFSEVVGGLLTPIIHDDPKHVPIGVTGLAINAAGNLEIYTDPAGADQVVTCYTNPDETMTRMGVTCGPSGGLTETTVKMNLDGSPVRADDDRLQHPYANLWCFWVWSNADASPIKTTIDDLTARVTALEAEAPQ